MKTERKIEILVPVVTTDSKHGLPSLGKSRFQATMVDPAVVSENLKHILSDLQSVLDELPKSTTGYYVDEIELNLGISGNGSVALIGRLEAGVEAGIKVTLKRK